MTATGASWSAPQAIAHPPARYTAKDALIFGLSVLIMLIYSQGWIAPIFGETTDESASAFLRVAYFPAYGAALLIVLLSFQHSLRALIRQPLLLLILGIVAASSLWLVAPDQTERRIIAIVFTTLGGVAVGARYRWSEMTEVLATCLAILAVFSLLLGAAVPGIGRMTDLFPGAWRGVWNEKNLLGDNMTMGFIVFTAAALLEPRRRMLWGGFAVLALLLVLLSTSKTSLVSLMLGAAAIVFVALVRRGPIMGVISSFGAVVALFAVLAVVFFAADVALALVGKDATLTGRTSIWKGVIFEIHKRPLEGYGYGAVWNDTTGWGPLAWITKIAGFRAYHSHNSWLEQWLGLGVFGLTAWALYFTQTLVNAIIAVYRDKGAYLALPFLLVYGLVSLTESIAVVYNDFRWVMFVAIAVKLAYPDKTMDRAA